MITINVLEGHGRKEAEGLYVYAYDDITVLPQKHNNCKCSTGRDRERERERAAVSLPPAVVLS